MKSTAALNQRLLAILLCMMGISSAFAAAPINDSATKAIELKTNYRVLPGQNLSLAAAAATDPLINGAAAGKSLWYRRPYLYAPGQNYWTVTIKSSTASGYACFYKMIDEDNPLTGLVQLGSPVTIAAGQTQTIQGYSDFDSLCLMVAGTGTFDLVHRYSPTLYDFPSTAFDLTGDQGTKEGDTTSATLSADEPPLPDGAPGITNILWFKWTPSFTGTAGVDTNFSALSGDPDRAQQGGLYDPNMHDTVLAVFQGASSEALTVVGWDDDSGWSSNSRVLFSAVSGTTYYIGVSTAAGKMPGAFQLNYYRANSPGELYIASGPASYSQEISEKGGSHTVTVRRRYASNSLASVNLSTVAGGTATAGSDFQALNTQVSFTNPSGVYADDAWEAEVNLNILNDSTAESSETVKLQLTSPSVGATLRQSYDTRSVTIVDDDTAVPGDSYTLSLQHKVLRVREDSGSQHNMVSRTRMPGAEGIQLMQTQKSGTASNWKDFYLSYAFLGVADQSVELPFTIKDDDEFEDEETIEVTVSANLSYTIIIEDNDPFVPVAGRLLAPLEYSHRGRLAQLIATVSRTGAVTGKLFLVGQTLPIKTQLDWHGKAVVALAPVGRPGLSLTIQATNAYGGYRFSLYDSADNWSDETTAELQNYASVTNSCPEAGRFTFYAGDIGNPQAAATSSAGSIVVDASGNAVIAGRLFDGSSYATSGYIDGAGQITACAMLPGQGCIGFKRKLPASVGQTSSLGFVINRTGRAGDSAKLSAVSQDYVNGYACRYSPPASGQAVLESWSTGTGKATLYSGPLPMLLTKPLTISTKNVITAPIDAEKLKLTVTPSTGIFTGSLVLPGTTKTVAIYGALIDLPTTNGYGQGFFFDGLKGGSIQIRKP